MQTSAIEQLYRQHARALIGHCTGLLNNSAQARDAVHEAFERLLRGKREDVAEDTFAVPYLYRISTNICLDMLRHQQVWRRVEPQAYARAVRAEVLDPLHDERDYARTLLDRLTPRTAAVGVMHFVEGMNQQEIASELGMSRRSIFNHLKKLEQEATELANEASHFEGVSR